MAVVTPFGCRRRRRQRRCQRGTGVRVAEQRARMCWTVAGRSVRWSQATADQRLSEGTTKRKGITLFESVSHKKTQGQQLTPTVACVPDETQHTQKRHSNYFSLRLPRHTPDSFFPLSSRNKVMTERRRDASMDSVERRRTTGAVAVVPAPAPAPAAPSDVPAASAAA